MSIFLKIRTKYSSEGFEIQSYVTNLRNTSGIAAQNFEHCYDVMCDAHSGDNSL